MMSYEKLNVYQCAIDFLGFTVQVIDEMPKGSSIIVDQLKRAAISMPLNIGEGAGKRSKADCRKYFDIARGSAMECGAILDVCLKLNLVRLERFTSGKALLERIVAMLTKLAEA